MSRLSEISSHRMPHSVRHRILLETYDHLSWFIKNSPLRSSENSNASLVTEAANRDEFAQWFIIVEKILQLDWIYLHLNLLRCGDVTVFGSNGYRDRWWMLKVFNTRLITVHVTAGTGITNLGFDQCIFMTWEGFIPVWSWWCRDSLRLFEFWASLWILLQLSNLFPHLPESSNLEFLVIVTKLT